MYKQYTSRFWKVALVLLALWSSTLLLAGCGDPPVDRVAEINNALKATGYTPGPTVDPTKKALDAFGFTLAIFGIRDYYPNRSGEKITVNILNQRETSIYASQICAMMLQRQTGPNTWEDIAYGRPCPPTDTNSFRIYPNTAIDISFEFDKTRPLPGKSWNVPGTYHLLFTYYMRCPDAYNTISYCEDQRQYASDSFQIKLDGEAPKSNTNVTPGPTPTANK
jgi:hypothetical protein